MGVEDEVAPVEVQRRKPDAIVQQGVMLILEGLGLDLGDANLKDTPARVTRMFNEMFCGLWQTAEVESLLRKTFPSTYRGIIVHSGIHVFSMCPHHLLPVEYDIAVAYVAEYTVGLSKLPRVIELLAKRPILQETLTEEIADALEKHLYATGVVVVVKGKHSCMRVRGVRTLSDVVTTSSLRGLFNGDSSARAEALSLIHNGGMTV